jgi:hypothetical protein
MDSSSRTLHSPFKPIYFQIAAAAAERCVCARSRAACVELTVGLYDGE